MAKLQLDIYDKGTVVYCLAKNQLFKGIIASYKLYAPGCLKYSIKVIYPGDEVIIDDVPSTYVYESKQAYVDYIIMLDI